MIQSVIFQQANRSHREIRTKEAWWYKSYQNEYDFICV